MTATAGIDSTTFYRREARRLRSHFGDDPLRLHRSLQALSKWQNLSAPSQQVWKRETRTDHVQDLVAAVVDRMEGPILRYPARVALLRQAQRAGMGQFDANLIITAVQHRLGERIVRQPRPSGAWMRNLVIIAIMQAWIVAGIYWLMT